MRLVHEPKLGRADASVKGKARAARVSAGAQDGAVAVRGWRWAERHAHTISKSGWLLDSSDPKG